MNQYVVWSRDTREQFGVYEAETEDRAISSMLADKGVSPHDADPSLTADLVTDWSEDE